MKTYAEFQEKIEGLQDVQETVETIEKISAAKIIFWKQKVKQLNFYVNNLKSFLIKVLAFYIVKNNIFLTSKKQGKKILIIVTSDKGLVGDLWHQITEEVLSLLSSYDIFYTIGNKGKKLLEEEGVEIKKNFIISTENINENEILKINNFLITEFQKKDIKSIDIIYADFKSISEQKIVKVPFLPFDFKLEENDENIKSNLIIFEPNKKKVFDNILKKFINSFFYAIILKSILSEFSAKTLEMENAAKKSQEIILSKKKKFIKDERKETTQRQLESFIYKK